ncbi:RNA polymerase-associated protein rapA [Candidatus Thiosymbion oneisti]|uniref:RNA polymerase-associated protein rapA n=1 Tax=Candidatus Thiosymbion oneisti TaxID=589554 RepID=UPI000B22493F|nr:RNA polymerase-associated protein rapA [Candidatus Thiosymbion oneisti]
MTKPSITLTVLCLLVAVSSVALGDFELTDNIRVNGFLQNRTAFNLDEDPYIGEEAWSSDRSSAHAAGNVLRFENAARLFFNGELGTAASWHADINLIYDTQGVNQYWRGHENYTQYDYLRELYLDTELAGIDLRLGKQQLVWGTADGIKLLDIINPTDFRWWNQDPMEDARIPVWMAVAERNLGSNGNLQAVVSQRRQNIIPGLRKGEHGVRSVAFVPPSGPSAPPGADNSRLFGTDQGHAFIMKGVDTITGKVNGFANIGAAMGAVTTTFYGDGFLPMPTSTFTNPLGGLNPALPELNTVGSFTNLTAAQTPAACRGVNGAACLKNFTEFTNGNITNLTDADPVTGAGWDTANPDSTWEYMPNTTLATFAAFTGMTTRYQRDYPGDTDVNLGLRYRGNLDNGLNFSLNYLYAYDPNPAVQIHWADPNTGEKLQVVDVTYQGPAGELHTLQVKNSAGKFYGAPAVDYSEVGNRAGLTDVTAANYAGSAPQLVFEETLNRIHNIGASFDYAWDLDLGDAPVVLRGEFLYQKDVLSPVIDRHALSYGHLTEALKMEKGDYFKYVLGADFTFFTNLAVSGQFIQFTNLDYVDEVRSRDPVTGQKFSRYTGDQATLHLDNGLKRGYEHKRFGSLFLSKPFGPSQEHRINNIAIFEEGGGWWNRLDLEYTIRDELLATLAWNHYWGSEDTLFGQFGKASNIQLGIKYLFE